MPDRDYYLKDDAKLAAYRTEYVAMLAHELQARRRRRARRGRRRRDGDGDGAGEGPLDQRREPRDHQDSTTSSPSPTWPASSPASTGPPGRPSSASRRRRSVIVGQPSYAKAMAAAVSEWPVDRWKTYLKAAVIRALRAVSSARRSSTRGSSSTARRCRARRRSSRAGSGPSTPSTAISARWSAGSTWRSTSRPRPRPAWSSSSRTSALAYRDGIDHLDWMSPETKKQAHRQAGGLHAEDRLPRRSGATTRP